MKKRPLLTALSLFLASSFIFGGIVKSFNKTSSEPAVVLADDMDSRREQLISDIYNYVDLDDFEEPTKTALKELMDEYAIKVELTNQPEVLDYLMEEFGKKMDAIISGKPYNPVIPDDPDVPTFDLDVYKREVIDYIGFNVYGTDVYYVFQSEIDAFLGDILDDIRNASSKEEVDTALDLFKEKMSKYPSNIDVYLAQLKYDMRESFMSYIADVCYDLSIFIDEDDFNWLVEGLEDELVPADTYDEIMDAYNRSTIGAYNYILNYNKHSSNPSSKSNVTKTALIVACAVEGAIIVAGAILGIVFFRKRKAIK